MADFLPILDIGTFIESKGDVSYRVGRPLQDGPSDHAGAFLGNGGVGVVGGWRTQRGRVVIGEGTVYVCNLPSLNTLFVLEGVCNKWAYVDGFPLTRPSRRRALWDRP